MKVSEITDEPCKTIVEYANSRGWHVTKYNNEDEQFRIRLEKNPSGESKRRGGLTVLDAIEKAEETKKIFADTFKNNKSFYSPYSYKIKGDSLVISAAGRID